MLVSDAERQDSHGSTWTLKPEKMMDEEVMPTEQALDREREAPIPEELAEGLRRIVAAISNCGPDLSRTFDGVAETAESIKSALQGYGYGVSLGQAEEVYALYSQNKWASWLIGGCPTVESARKMLTEFSSDILYGENHASI